MLKGKHNCSVEHIFLLYLSLFFSLEYFLFPDNKISNNVEEGTAESFLKCIIFCLEQIWKEKHSLCVANLDVASIMDITT